MFRALQPVERARSALQMPAQIGRGSLDGALEVEGRDEAAFLVHQIDNGGVVDGVAAFVERHLLEISPVGLGDRGDLLRAAGEAGQIGSKFER